MTNTYYAGNLIRVTATFANASGVVTDPTTVTLKYRAGRDAAVTTVVYPSSPIVKDSTGVYHADLDTTGSGTVAWSYEWVGTGTVQAVNTSAFQVQVPVV